MCKINYSWDSVTLIELFRNLKCDQCHYTGLCQSCMVSSAVVLMAAYRKVPAGCRRQLGWGGGGGATGMLLVQATHWSTTHYTKNMNCFKMGSSKSSFATKSCTCTSISFLAGFFSWAVISTLLLSKWSTVCKHKPYHIERWFPTCVLMAFMCWN
jgi:hypothetical protein